MNVIKTFRFLLPVVFYCFVTINCSETLSSSGRNNELIVSNSISDVHNGPILSNDSFGPYKLIRPLPELNLNFYMKYDVMLAWGLLAYLLRDNKRFPGFYRCVSFGLASHFAIFHLPSLFGLHWVASINQQARTSSISLHLGGMLFFDILSGWISKILNEPRIYLYTTFALRSYFSVRNLPLLFGVHFVTSYENSEGLISPASQSMYIDEIFLAEGIVPYDRNVCFRIFSSIQLVLAEAFVSLFGLKRFP